jgi:hypothetical protein
VLLTVYCVLEAWTLWGPGLQAETADSTIKWNVNVTTESSPWRWPSRVETCRSVLRLVQKPFVHLLVINVFCIRSEGHRQVPYVHWAEKVFSPACPEIVPPPSPRDCRGKLPPSWPSILLLLVTPYPPWHFSFSLPRLTSHSRNLTWFIVTLKVEAVSHTPKDP